MDKSGWVLSLFLTQVTLSLGIVTRGYYLVQLEKTWSEAQSYCQENFVDLATLETVEDWGIVRAMRLSSSQNLWIGLYDDYQSWRWSRNNTFLYTNGSTGLGSWFVFDVDNYLSAQHCAQFIQGTLNDWFCDDLKNSVCYDEPTDTYIPVTIPMNWSSAQSYCRKTYTDLTSIRDQQEHQKILSVTDQSDWWIGLFRDGWKWSDQSNSLFRQWDSPEPSGGTEHCAHARPGGFNDVPCELQYPFICSVPTIKLFKFVLKSEGSVDLNTTDGQEAVLNHMEKLMRDGGISQKFLLTWRKPPTGKI